MDALTAFLRGLGVAGGPLEGIVPVGLVFLAAALLTVSFIPRVRRFAIRAGLADMPNERRINKEPLPNLGGLAIYGGVVAALVLALALKPAILSSVQVQLLAIMLGGTVLVLTGFIDDQFELPSLFRLAVVQPLAAGLLVANGIRMDLPFLSPPLDAVLTVLWVVGITNAVNFMDGIDGLVGGLGFISASVLLATSAQFPDRAAATLVLAALAGGCLGFLRHNFNPSRIIMGDAGATFVGYVLAAVSILGVGKTTAFASLAAPLLFLAVPILDTTQVVIRRLARGVSPATPSKEHLHHQLLGRGLSQRTSVVLLWAAILIANVAGMALQRVPGAVIAVTVAGVVFLLAVAASGRVREARRERLRLERKAEG